MIRPGLPEERPDRHEQPAERGEEDERLDRVLAHAASQRAVGSRRPFPDPSAVRRALAPGGSASGRRHGARRDRRRHRRHRDQGRAGRRGTRRARRRPGAAAHAVAGHARTRSARRSPRSSGSSTDPGPIGITMPAVVRDGIVETAANIDPAWIGVDAAELFGDALGRDVTVMNDADAAGLAEMPFGAGQGSPRHGRGRDPRHRDRERGRSPTACSSPTPSSATCRSRVATPRTGRRTRSANATSSPGSTGRTASSATSSSSSHSSGRS